jgi:hypothetical protein
LLGDVVLKKDPVNGRGFLEYSERMTKTRDGTGKENRKVKPRLYGNGKERDPLELFDCLVTGTIVDLAHQNNHIVHHQKVRHHTLQ